MIFYHKFTKIISGILFVTLLINNISPILSTDIYVSYGDDSDFFNDYYGSNEDSQDINITDFRSGIDYLVQHGGGNLYVNYTENPIELYFGPITIYPENNTNISIIGIPDIETGDYPTININSYYIYVFRNTNLYIENLKILGNSEINHYKYVYFDNDYYYIGNNGGCIAIENSNLNITNCEFEDCSADNSGGAIYTHNTNLNVYDSTFINNVARSHMTTDGSGGGGIYFNGSNNTINIVSTMFKENIGKYGGAIKIASSNQAHLYNNTFESNTANQNGGAILTNDSILNIDNSVFTNNFAQSGGSIYISSGEVNINDNSIFKNNGALTGAVIVNDESKLYMEQCSFISNYASNEAGAIYNLGTLNLIGCLFSENTSGDESSNNILSLAEYYYNITLVANIFNGSIGCHFGDSNLYAKIDRCDNIKNDTKYNCPLNTTCYNEPIGYRCVCPAGTYQEGMYGTIECMSCPPGTYCPDIATNIPRKCPVGAYCVPDTAFVCPVGYYCPERNITNPYYCGLNNNMSCPLGSIYNMSDYEVKKHLNDIEFDDEVYNLDKYSVKHNDYEEYDVIMWNKHINIIITCVIVLSLSWFLLVSLITRYNIKNKYIDRLSSIDLFSMNHYFRLNVPIKKRKTVLGGSITILFLTSFIFVTWFYTLRYNYDNSQTIVTHVTNASMNTAEYLNIGFSFEGVIPQKDEFDITILNGISGTSTIELIQTNHNITHTSVQIKCENCKFNDDEITLSVCSKYNDTYIRKILWNATTPSFRNERVSYINGIILPSAPLDEVWKNNGTDTPIIILFLKPVNYVNYKYPEEDNEGYSIEFQERFIGATKNKCTFLGDDVCGVHNDTIHSNHVHIVTSGNSFSGSVCDEDKIGIKILIKRTVGYYDIRVINKYMMMDLMAEVFAMLSACFTGVAYLLVGMEMTYPKTQHCDKKFYKCIKCLKCGKRHKNKHRTNSETNSEDNTETNSEVKLDDNNKDSITKKKIIVIDTKEPIVENVVMTKIKYNTFVETEV